MIMIIIHYYYDYYLLLLLWLLLLFIVIHYYFFKIIITIIIISITGISIIYHIFVYIIINYIWGISKWWIPKTMGFNTKIHPKKMDDFGVP